ncbi:hypothetical protein FRX31_006722 [Thalictrum thalictroides]|uniref:Defensin-like protein n=1 Tax=Thalictrum thalictroides TaxID=46969 RepID=A0A7J6X4E6_THATH|nr:hypothetical protein FRX31_006722 [Thalictrum thalictroides]
MASKKVMLCKCISVLFLFSVYFGPGEGFDPNTHCQKYCRGGDSACVQRCNFAGFNHGRSVHKLKGPEHGFDPKTHCKKYCSGGDGACADDCNLFGFNHGRCVDRREGPPYCCCS